MNGMVLAGGKSLLFSNYIIPRALDKRYRWTRFTEFNEIQFRVRFGYWLVDMIIAGATFKVWGGRGGETKARAAADSNTHDLPI